MRLRPFMLAGMLSVLPAMAQAGPYAAPAPLDHFAGKVVYVDFWASWCAPCAESFPWLNSLKEKFGDRLAVVGVDVDTHRQDGDRFLRHHPANFAIIRDPGGELASHYDLPGMPTGLILDRQGKVVSHHVGFHAEDVGDYEAAISAALAHADGAQP